MSANFEFPKSSSFPFSLQISWPIKGWHKAGDAWGTGGTWLPPLFCVVKGKKVNKVKKGRVSKQKLFKVCHQGQNITVSDILESLEFKIFSCRPTILFSIPWPVLFEMI